MALKDEVDLPLPFGGVSEDLAHSQQDDATCSEAFNFRGQDPTNGRERLSQRAGMTKACEDAIQPGVPVREIISTVVDARNLEYSSAAGAEVEEWSVATPSKKPALMVVTDDQGSVYVTDGPAALVKLNPDGTIVWQFPLPVKDPNHVIRFVHVDELGDLYTGVSTGTRQTIGQVWKLTQLPDNEVEVAWTVEFDAFVEAVKVYKDKLYTLHNEPDVKRSYVRVLGSLDAAAPALAQEITVAYPGHDLDVGADGSVFVASGGDEGSSTTALPLQRAPNPKFPEFAPEAVDWTPYDLENFDLRIWSWFVADDITEFDVLSPYVQDALVGRWPDRSGKGRHLYAANNLGKKPPTLRFEGLGSHAVVSFNGVDQALFSLTNPSTTKASADQQRTALPAYEGSAFLSLMVVRPENRATGSAMYVFGQDNVSAGTIDHILIANQNSAGAFAAGILRHDANSAGANPGQGTGGKPLEASYDNANDYAIVAMLWDGGLVPGSALSLFQLCGKPIDQYEGQGNTTKEATILGFWTSGAISHLQGDVVEWINLDRRDRTSVTLPLVVSHDTLETGSGAADQTVNELTRLVGYLAHKYGLQHLLPKESDTFPHPYGAKDATLPPPGGDVFTDTVAGPPSTAISGDELGAHGRTERTWPILAKYNPAGDLVWALNGEDEDPDVPDVGVRGMGWGVRVDHEGNLFSIGPDEGPPYTSPPGPPFGFLRKVIDQGDTYSLQVVDGAWTAPSSEPLYAYPRMTVDKFGNLYVTAAGLGAQNVVLFDGSDGTKILDFDYTGTGHSIAIDPLIPDYGEDLTTPFARFVYVVGEGVAPEDTVLKMRLVLESALTGSPREHVHLAIAADGTIKTFELGGALSTPTGASGKLVTDANYIQAATGFEKIIISDGVSPLVVYDPRTDTCSVLESSTAGEPPHGAKILEVWQGRLVGMRAASLINGAFNWLMSAAGDFTNYDTFPVERTPAAAIGGSNAVGPGIVPDLPTGFVPYDDDIAFVGCDHAIYLLTGNPGDGGQFDLVSDITGMAFGRAWCKDPDGNVWFIGSRGGLYRMPPGGRPKRVSRKIDARLKAINFATHYTRLAWNDDDDGIHIHRYPFGTPGAPVEHWFWDTNRGAPWPDSYGTVTEPDVEPTAIYVVDGDDPEDRLVLLGGRDGFIRKWDLEARDDDGTAIDAQILIGPLLKADAKREYRFRGPRVVLASEHDGAVYQLYGSPDPAQPGAARHTGELNPGRNPLKGTKVRGSYCWVRIRNSLAGQRVAIEEAKIRVYPAGLKRVRESL